MVRTSFFFLFPTNVVCYDKYEVYRHGRDCLVVGFKVASSNPVHGELYWIQQYVIKFVSDLRQVGDFLREL
jgi:hypothetical protein